MCLAHNRTNILAPSGNSMQRRADASIVQTKLRVRAPCVALSYCHVLWYCPATVTGDWEGLSSQPQPIRSSG
eukprot:scaffold662772_cov45-Prasinocladus_malaysianus.AAC.2